MHQELNQLLWHFQSKGGFEAALASLQGARLPGCDGENLRLALEAALRRMFRDMNSALKRRQWEFQSDRQWMISPFLARFDAIFTLNQDTLLEQHYCDGVELSGSRLWHGVQFPGMKVLPSSQPPILSEPKFCAQMTPDEAEAQNISSNLQPIFKLHGSSNWVHDEQNPMLIMGGEKAAEIAQVPILAWYAQEFSARLSTPDARLMVIGYSFNDQHINAHIIDGIKKGLKIFVISPDGADTFAKRIKPCGSSELNQDDALFQRAMIGASRRPLSDTFSHDIAEQEKLLRFFSKV